MKQEKQYIHIQSLLERYYEAQTSSEEELELYLALVDEPEDSPLYPDALILRAQWEGRAQDDSSVEIVSAPLESATKPLLHSWIPWLCGAVAVLVLGLVLRQFAGRDDVDHPDSISLIAQEAELFFPFGEEYNFAGSPLTEVNEQGRPAKLITQQVWGWERETDSVSLDDLYTPLYQSARVERNALGEVDFVVELKVGGGCPEYVVEGIRAIE